MLKQINGASLVLGIAIGGGLVFLGGAGAGAGKPSSQPAAAAASPAAPVGRFQIATTHTNDQMTAYILDTQTGQSVQLYNGGNTSSIADPWKNQP